jgi:hypothetical protein
MLAVTSILKTKSTWKILTDTRRFWKSQKSKLLEMGKLEIPAGFPIIKW